MAEFVFWSGQYRRWTFHKQYGVPFYMRKIRIPHLEKVFEDEKIKTIHVQVDGQSLKDWFYKKDDLFFGKTFFRGNYSVCIEVTYSDLEPTVYRKWNE
jgi:hypothetical protein